MDDLDSKMKRRVKRLLSGKRPSIWVGKNKVSNEILKEIEKQLEKSEMVKVKFLRSALSEVDPKQIATEIAEQTGASLVEVRGHTFILYRRRKK